MEVGIDGEREGAREDGARHDERWREGMDDEMLHAMRVSSQKRQTHVNVYV